MYKLFFYHSILTLQIFFKFKISLVVFLWFIPFFVHEDPFNILNAELKSFEYFFSKNLGAMTKVYKIKMVERFLVLSIL